MPLDGNALVGSSSAKPYDAVYFQPDPDRHRPGADPRLLAVERRQRTSGTSGQTSPATAWERQIDELMTKQAAALDMAERQRAVHRSAADLRRAPADALLRGAADLRGDLSRAC